MFLDIASVNSTFVMRRELPSAWGLRVVDARHIFAASVTLAVAGVASATIVPIGAFTGEYRENFSAFATGFRPNGLTAMGGVSTLSSATSSGLLPTTSWGFRGTILPHSDRVFLGNFASATVWTFNTTVYKFGGYFGTNANTLAGGTATFYDSSNAVIGTMPIDAPKLTWAWNGWESSTPIARVQVALNAFNGAFLMQDTMEASVTPAPATGVLAIATLLAFGHRRAR